MKKRIAAFLLAAAMLMLAACGRKTDRAPSTDAEMQVRETQATEAATEPEIDAEAVYLSLQGYYQDSVSQRATLYAWLTDGGLGLRVNWSSSASEETEWDMTAVLTREDGNQVHLLVYEFQDENGAWLPTAFDKIEKLPAEMEEMLARF